MSYRRKPGEFGEQVKNILESHQYGYRDANWNKLNKVLSSDETKAYFKLYEKEFRLRRRRIVFSGIAAAFILVIVPAGILLNNIKQSPSLHTLASGDTEKYYILPDSSEVWLNRNSNLSFYGYPDAEVREVTLSGEAYFKVKPITDCPFQVSTPLSRIRVVGTEFNVRAYGAESSEKVTVLSGKVFVEGLREQENITFYLREEEGCIIQQSDSTLKKQEKISYNDISWKTDQLVFDNTPLNEVIRELEKMNHISVRLSDNELQDIPLSATYTDMETEDILEIIGITLNLKIRKENDTIWISGTR